MKILEYIGLDPSRVAEPYRRATEAIAHGDFRAADVKKLANLHHGKFYRAKLGHADRLLFTFVRRGAETCALMLEVIEQHDYAKSRFLRGATVDEGKIADTSPAEAHKQAQPLRYLHPERRVVHVLDKPISFDDAQEAIYRLPPPLVVVGGAGSGKTALALEKLKHIEGEALYVTHSAYLAQNARDLYYAEGFERDDQEVEFLSYRNLIESVRVPAGREATWRDFSGWFARLRQGQMFRDIQAHQAFEEIRGVIAARADGVLAREEYRALGVRQSIFPVEDRGRVHDLFEKYRAWLSASGLYDLNLIAHEWRRLATPRYDFVVVDEVQDLTTAQLGLILSMLKVPDGFLLCGDSNQIVHPNFFAWSQVKSLFWRDRALGERQQLRVLSANFRNAPEITRLGNTLLTIKQQRFGSIDRESNFLVRAVGEEPGCAALLPATDHVLRDLDGKTRVSTRFAVLVMREEDKAPARERFSTPLLFSVHEAKGLEYESIVLYRFVSDHRREFAALVEGVERERLEAAELEYRRAPDKADKSLETYKFFVNALYVAVTRAVRNVYIVESDTSHALFGLLGLTAEANTRVEAQRSSLEDWQREAHKLELQGKEEQAEAIRRTILKPTPPPWPVVDEAAVREMLVKVFRERVPGDRTKRKLYEYAAWHDEPQQALWLAEEAGFGTADALGARGFAEQRTALWRKYLSSWSAARSKDVLRQCEQYGLEHRTPVNQTPLMAAASAGNVTLVEALLDRGADREATDHYGQNALHWALREGFRHPPFAHGPLAALYDLLAPAALDVMVGQRLVRVDKHLSEYFLFQSLWALFKSRFTHYGRAHPGFDTSGVLQAWQHLPPEVLRPQRHRRQHLSAVLSRNEVDRDYAWNRALFKRLRQGWYQFNPALAVRVRTATEECWCPVFTRLNLPLVAESTRDYNWSWLRHLAQFAQVAVPDVPLAAECAIARRQAELDERELTLDHRLAPWVRAKATQDVPESPEDVPEPAEDDPGLAQEVLAASATANGVINVMSNNGGANSTHSSTAANPSPADAVGREKPRWGTPEARRRALEELRLRIEEERRRAAEGRGP
ncbi:MAG TPA: ankyrin repeat domain-containing protein [Steroidobacteraceae bacterium]|nr:ankyrin repeat domain-containing protein [Steroidobacteraceae bacterium]